MQELNYLGTALGPLYPRLLRNGHKETKPVVWGSQTVGSVLLLCPVEWAVLVHTITAPFAVGG